MPIIMWVIGYLLIGFMVYGIAEFDDPQDSDLGITVLLWPMIAAYILGMMLAGRVFGKRRRRG